MNCSRSWHLLLSGTSNNKKGSNCRYLRVKYEALAGSPLATMRGVLNFLSQPFTAQMHDAVVVKTSSMQKLGEDDPSHTTKNSHKHIDSWRSELSFLRVKHIQQTCSDVLEELGLRTFGSESELHNYTIKVTSIVD